MSNSKTFSLQTCKELGLGLVIPLLNASPAVLATSQEDGKLTWNPVRCLPSCLGTLYTFSYPTLQQPWKVGSIGFYFWMRKQRLEEVQSFLQSHRDNGFQIWTQICKLLNPYSFRLFSTSFLGSHVSSCKTWLLNISFRASLVAQLVKNLWETWVWSLDWEDPLGKETATHSSILAWRIPWTIHGFTKSDTTEWLSLNKTYLLNCRLITFIYPEQYKYIGGLQ